MTVRRGGSRRKRVSRRIVRTVRPAKVRKKAVRGASTGQPRRKTVVASDRRTWKRGVVFVGMAFGQRRSKDILSAIDAACASLQLKCERSDRQVGSPPLVATIKKLIEDAEYLVFDLSYERPNVYYELGYAHGVGNHSRDVLLVAKHGSIIHFDTRDLHVHFYKNKADQEAIIHGELAKMMNSSRRPRRKVATKALGT